MNVLRTTMHFTRYLTKLKSKYNRKENENNHNDDVRSYIIIK